MKPIRWGIISASRIAQSFASDMRLVERSEILAVTNRTHSNAQAFADKNAIARVYHSHHEMLNDDDIDAVYVASPHTLHDQYARDAIEAGKAVLCEKPLVTNIEDCERLFAYVEQASGYLMEAMWTWFLPAMKHAKQWVEQGRIGKIQRIHANFGFPILPYTPQRREYNTSLGGGTLLDMGIYPVALLWLFLQRQPTEVQASARYAPNGVEDDISAILDYTKDCTASIASSFRSRLDNVAYIMGENGNVVIPDFWQARSCYLHDSNGIVESFEDARESIGLNFETQAVVDDLLRGDTTPSVVTHADSLAFQKTMSQIRTGFRR